MALSEPPYDNTEIRDLAHRSRMESALMTVTRLSALFDSDGTAISFQGVNRGLKSSAVRDELARLYSADRSSHLAQVSVSDCLEYQDKFLQNYGSIDWAAYARLQDFRNREIAHLTPEDTLKRITHGEMAEFAHLAFSLQDATTLLICGQNTDLRQEADEDAEHYKAVWLKAFGAA